MFLIYVFNYWLINLGSNNEENETKIWLGIDRKWKCDLKNLMFELVHEMRIFSVKNLVGIIFCLYFIFQALTVVFTSVAF